MSWLVILYSICPSLPPSLPPFLPLRLYYKGRTETIRPVSDTSVSFCKAMCDPSASKDSIKQLLKQAIE